MGVDPAWLPHSYGSKVRLFTAVTALPFDPALVIAELAAGARRGLSRRLARFVVTVMESFEALGLHP